MARTAIKTAPLYRLIKSLSAYFSYDLNALPCKDFLTLQALKDLRFILANNFIMTLNIYRQFSPMGSFHSALMMIKSRFIFELFIHIKTKRVYRAFSNAKMNASRLFESQTLMINQLCFYHFKLRLWNKNEAF